MASHTGQSPLQRHPMWRAAAVFAFLTGALMLAVWIWRWTSGVLAADTALSPYSAWTQAIAEIATAIALIIAGYGLITGASWIRRFYLVATGMLLFAGVIGLGQHADRGEPIVVFIYLFFGAVAVFFALRVEED